LKNLEGYIKNADTGAPIVAAIVASGLDNTINTTTDSTGFFSISVLNSDTFIQVYAIGTGTNGGGLSTWYIPEPIPNSWNIALPSNLLNELVITPKEKEKTNLKKLFPVYAGLALFLFLLFRKKRQ